MIIAALVNLEPHSLNLEPHSLNLAPHSLNLDCTASNMEYLNATHPNVTDTWRTIDQFTLNLEGTYHWFIFALGFPGNCATIVTVIKMSPARSLTVYIALLAVVDNLAILTKILIFELPDNGVDVGNVGCKILGYLGNFLTTYANWLLVAMSAERCAAVWFPFRMGKSWTFRKSIITVVLITLPVCGVFMHLFWMMRSQIDGDMVYCGIYNEYTDFMQIWYWINVIIYAVIPCIVLIIFNLLIVFGIVRSSREQKFLNSSKVNSTARGDRHRQITVMLVTSAVALVILTTPRCVMLILTPYWTPNEYSMEGAIQFLIDTLAFVLCDFTHAMNFYVYSVSAKRFRREFVELFTCSKKAKNAFSSQYMSLSIRQSSHRSRGTPHQPEESLVTTT